ncbi:flagellar biosynthesis protein FliQ [Shewanella sp. SR43-4]|jgi:flagellar biosynthetic protein FliQ|uniref:Flagellar biosynthetic protein FliQ n=2 Tax=Shewanella TaxID=22 RepID=A0ABV0FJB9_9GAMM|nr:MULTISPECIES: flagellar biosynthesis protein FliQ [Shewanella]NCQ46267.1 flagellar biosynthesis protein FliQ [Shewanella frigidimarina]MBB1318205.1 flagellar biosynthesis protein FliQ [Shewanella sp. SR43-4]MBB1477453.1 flagellar biosynthesis protein FliQ [Shewanella sp. SG41-3]NCO73099.1 flagellar biosynthesis protein FliQ [Shewanella vesiculosa]NCP38551.1 flagellar biosynthesis protein FliQ [Shewanella vesiculosa]|tara:strand:+ start:5183 stop:5452 length:270 start_codon:yes stop_codon:yes gene_type:complete
MSPESLIDIFREALSIIVLIVSAIILPGLFIGLIVAVFQAATSINEQTLSFLPRLLVTLFALMFLGHWLVQTMMDFFYEMVNLIPQVIG